MSRGSFFSETVKVEMFGKVKKVLRARDQIFRMPNYLSRLDDREKSKGPFEIPGG